MAREVEENSSESDSSSDEELDKSVNLASESVKKYLNEKGILRQTESSTDFIHATHRKIYASFDSDEDTDKDIDNKPEETNNKSSSTQLQSTSTFILDTKGSQQLPDNDTNELETEVFTIDLSGLNDDAGSETKDAEAEEMSPPKQKKKKDKNRLSSRLDAGVGTKDVYVNMDALKNHKQKNNEKRDERKKVGLKEKKIIEEPEIMKKCVLTDDYEKQVTIPTPHSKRSEKRDRKIEKEKTKGKKWFNMPAQEVTEERKNDFLVYQMRKSLDPKRFYRTNDAVGIPKYYQFGTVVEHSSDFYDSRVPKKQRKANMVEELLADAKFRQYNKRRYAAIQEAKRQGTGPYDDMKKLKRKKAK